MQEEVQRSLAQKQEQEAAVQLLQSKLVSASSRLEGMESVLASQQQESAAAAEAREEATRKAKALEVLKLLSSHADCCCSWQPLVIHNSYDCKHQLAPILTTAHQL